MTRLYAELADPEALVGAVAAARAAGATPVEVYAPYPSHAVERALGAPRSRLSVAVLAAGLGGAAGAYGLQWLLNAYLYPLDVGGRPPHFPLAFVPITFEMGVLFASLTAFLGVLVGGRLLRLWDPSRDVDGIESATATRCWLELETDASGPDLEELIEILRQAGALAVRRAGGAG
jgi:hypothetical protein